MNNILKKTFLLSSILIAMAGSLTPSLASAVDVFDDVCKGRAADSTACKEASRSGQDPISGPNGGLAFAINLMSTLVGIAAIVILIISGLKLVTSGSNPQEVSKARESIIYALIGLLVAFAGQIIVRVFLSKLGG